MVLNLSGKSCEWVRLDWAQHFITFHTAIFGARAHTNMHSHLNHLQGVESEESTSNRFSKSQRLRYVSFISPWAQHHNADRHYHFHRIKLSWAHRVVCGVVSMHWLCAPVSYVLLHSHRRMQMDIDLPADTAIIECAHMLRFIDGHLIRSSLLSFSPSRRIIVPVGQ